MEKQKFTRREQELLEQLEQAYQELQATGKPADNTTDLQASGTAKSGDNTSDVQASGTGKLADDSGDVQAKLTEEIQALKDKLALVQLEVDR
jgi:hypothetical protein